MGEVLAMVIFFRVQNVGVECLFGRFFIVHHVAVILPGLWKAVLHYSLSVAVIGQRSLRKPKHPSPLSLNTYSTKSGQGEKKKFCQGLRQVGRRNFRWEGIVVFRTL